MDATQNISRNLEEMAKIYWYIMGKRKISHRDVNFR